MKNASKLVNMLLLHREMIKVTKYLSDKLIIRATRRVYKCSSYASDPIEILITVGRPNAREQEFIKQCKRAGEPFPVKKIQVKFMRKK